MYVPSIPLSFEKEDIKQTVTGPAEEDLSSLKSHLQELRNTAVADLQKNVFRHYSTFTLISKEIENLEGVVGSMRGLLGELKGVEGALRSVAPVQSTFLLVREMGLI